MSTRIWAILRAILPTKKIGAWIVGVFAAFVALVMGVSSEGIKEHFCASPAVEIPKIEVKTPEALPEAPKVEAEKK